MMIETVIERTKATVTTTVQLFIRVLKTICGDGIDQDCDGSDLVCVRYQMRIPMVMV